MKKKDREYDNEERSELMGEFDDICRRYYDMVYKYVQYKISNLQVTEDIVQETFCIACAKRRILLAHPKPQLWLLCTARNKMQELYRRMRYRTTVPLEEEFDLGREEQDYRLKELELTAQMMLNEEEWKTIKDYYLYGRTISELAAAKGISENNMSVRLVRIRKKLRDSML